MIELREPPKITVETVPIPYDDRTPFEHLTDLVQGRRYRRPVHYFPGRTTVSNVFIRGTDALSLMEKHQGLTIGDYELVGIIPLSRDKDGWYECAVDYFIIEP